MRVHNEQLEIRTRGKTLHDVTAQVRDVVQRSEIANGLCHVFIRHTSASLLIQENADPAVLRDLERWFSELAPQERRWEHDDEGPDDMPAHARSALTKTSETIPVYQRRLGLGTWQGLYVWEHRQRSHHRQLLVTVTGE